jgi:hypothetical protein
MAESTPSPNAAMVRNIIVGVATSVIGAATLYFLGINKTGQSTSAKVSFYEEKEATIKGWKSYTTIDNIAYKNVQSVLKDFQNGLQPDNLNSKLEGLKENYLKEVHKFQVDVVEILKDQTMDKSFVSLLSRRLDMEKDAEQKLTTYIDNIKAIAIDNTMGMEDKQKRWLKEDQQFQNIARGMLERENTELEGLAKVLNEKFGQVFDLNESIAYKEYKNGSFNNNNNRQTDYTTSANNPQQDNNAKPVSNIPAQPQNTPNQYAANNNNNTNTGLNAGMFGGDWRSEGGTLHLDNQGFSWQWNDGKGVSQGNWRGDYQKMTLNITSGYNAGYSWTFILSDLTSNSFTMQLEGYAQYTYHQVKQ